MLAAGRPAPALFAITIFACGERILQVLDVCGNAVWPRTRALRSAAVFCRVQVVPILLEPLLSLWRTLLERVLEALGPGEQAGRGWGAGQGVGLLGGWEQADTWDAGSLACWMQVPLASQKDKACCLVMGTDLSLINASGLSSDASCFPARR